MNTINLSSREHNSLNECAMVIPLTKATAWTQKSLVEVDKLKGKTLVGAYVVRQNSGANKFSINGNQLLANNAIDNAFLTLFKNGTKVSEDIPLASLAVDPALHGPGQYKQFIIPDGIDQKECYVWFKSDLLAVATEDLVIHWVFIDEKVCGPVNICK